MPDILVKSYFTSFFVHFFVCSTTVVRFLAKGEMPNAVVQAWKEIWEKDKELNRRYTDDFEIYGEKSQSGTNSEVKIFIAVK